MSQPIEILVQTDSKGALLEPLVLGRAEIFWCGHFMLDIDGVKQSVWVTPKPNTEAYASDKVKVLQNKLEEFEAKWIESNNNLLVAHNELEGVNNDLKEQLEESEAKNEQLKEMCDSFKRLLESSAADLQNQLKESEAKYNQLQEIMTADRNEEKRKMDQERIKLERQLCALIESNEQLKVVNDDKEKAYRQLQEVCAKSKKRLRTQHRLQFIEVLEMTVKILQTE